MSASIPSSLSLRRGVLAGLVGMSLLATLLGCGGSSNNTNVVLPPGGVAIGNLTCTGTAEPPTNSVVHGQAIIVRFTLTDANVALEGANLPVSFDVIGGSLLDPPTHTDATGLIIVTFVADDPTFVGAGRVRLIGPDARLDCDVAFTVSFPAPTLRAETLNGAMAVVTPLDACGTTEFDVERHQVRHIRYTVTRPNPDTNVQEPVAGAFVRLTATGLTWSEMVIGPTDAMGRVTQIITPFPTGTGVATVTGTVVRPDADGPDDAPDGVPDQLASNTCVIGFNIVNPICDADGNAIVPVYRDAFGVAKAAPLRPGESADLTAFFVVDGVPQMGRAILVSAEDGFINGSPVPVLVMTDGAGMVSVTYTARTGFQGVDDVTFQDNIGTLQCTQTASVVVVTCDITLEFAIPPCSGCSVPTIVRVLNVDPATAIGETVALNAVGGAFTAQPPTGQLVDDGFGVPSIATTLHVTPGFSGPAALSLSYISGYACNSSTEAFVVTP